MLPLESTEEATVAMAEYFEVVSRVAEDWSWTWGSIDAVATRFCSLARTRSSSLSKAWRLFRDSWRTCWRVIGVAARTAERTSAFILGPRAHRGRPARLREVSAREFRFRKPPRRRRTGPARSTGRASGRARWRQRTRRRSAARRAGERGSANRGSESAS